jgi:GNAT superfamily N-acetyltransferase
VECGVARLLSKAMTRLGRRCGLNLLKVMHREPGRASNLRTTCAGLQCRVLSLEEAISFCSDSQLQMSKRMVQDAYQRDAVCLGAFVRGASHAQRLVGYTWLAYDPTRHAAGLWLEFGGSYRYSYKIFVRPAYRGQRIAQALHSFADDPALVRGRVGTLDIVDAGNASSLAALERAGARCIGYVAYWNAFGKMFAFSSPGAKKCGVRFYGVHRRPLIPLLRRAGLNICQVLIRHLPDQPEGRVLKGILEYRLMSEADLLPWSREPVLELKESMLRAAFARGDRCVGAFAGDRLVGYVFFAFQATPYSGDIWVDFDKRARYAYKAFLLPAYRGRRAGLELYDLSQQVCPSLDRTFQLAVINIENTPSVRSALSMGARSAGYLGYVELFGKFVPLRSPGARRHGFSFFKPDLVQAQPVRKLRYRWLRA